MTWINPTRILFVPVGVYSLCVLMLIALVLNVSTQSAIDISIMLFCVCVFIIINPIRTTSRDLTLKIHSVFGTKNYDIKLASLKIVTGRGLYSNSGSLMAGEWTVIGQDVIPDRQGKSQAFEILRQWQLDYQ